MNVIGKRQKWSGLFSWNFRVLRKVDNFSFQKQCYSGKFRTEEFSLFEGGGRGKQSNRGELKMLEKENAFKIMSKRFSVDLLFFNFLVCIFSNNYQYFPKLVLSLHLIKKVAKVFWNIPDTICIYLIII